MCFSCDYRRGLTMVLFDNRSRSFYSSWCDNAKTQIDQKMKSIRTKHICNKRNVQSNCGLSSSSYKYHSIKAYTDARSSKFCTCDKHIETHIEMDGSNYQLIKTVLSPILRHMRQSLLYSLIPSQINITWETTTEQPLMLMYFFLNN